MENAAQHCIYQYYLNNNVHKIILQDASHEAVDEGLQHLARIFDEAEHETSITLLLVDARRGVPSLPYVVQAMRQFYQKQTYVPPFRAAYVYNEGIVLALLERFLMTLRLVGTSRRFFRSETDHEALQWLVSGEN
jgi:hypothetical protein